MKKKRQVRMSVLWNRKRRQQYLNYRNAAIKEGKTLIEARQIAKQKVQDNKKNAHKVIENAVKGGKQP